MSPRCRFAPNRTKKVSLLAEPFRLFFPIGILASVLGVSLWPLLYAGGLGFNPAQAHARLMIEGFVGAFALGFIGTAFPKMIGSPPLRRAELADWQVEPGVPMAYDPTRQQLLLTMRKQGSQDAQPVLIPVATLQLEPLAKPVRQALWLPPG